MATRVPLDARAIEPSQVAARQHGRYARLSWVLLRMAHLVGSPRRADGSMGRRGDSGRVVRKWRRSSKGEARAVGLFFQDLSMPFTLPHLASAESQACLYRYAVEW